MALLDRLPPPGTIKGFSTRADAPDIDKAMALVADAVNHSHERVPVNVDNVVDYLAEIADSSGRVSPETVLVCLPPFQKTWFEWQGKYALIASVGKPEGRYWDHFRQTYPERVERLWKIIMYIHVYEAEKGVLWPSPVIGTQYVGFKGEPLGMAFTESVFDPSLVGLTDESALRLTLGAITTASVASTFMHAKNVIIRDNEPPERLQRARKRRGRAPMVTYKTLEIEPMKRVLKTEGRVDEVGLKQALHICRGHFKDYRERGLFGRESHRGIYWWDMHVRGNAEQGAVVKDYKVNAPK